MANSSIKRQEDNKMIIIAIVIIKVNGKTRIFKCIEFIQHRQPVKTPPFAYVCKLLEKVTSRLPLSQPHSSQLDTKWPVCSALRVRDKNGYRPRG